MCLDCVVTNGRHLLGLPSASRTISEKSIQTYLSRINAVHNDFEYPSPACGHLVNHIRSRRFLQSIFSVSFSSGLVPTPLSTTFVCVGVSITVIMVWDLWKSLASPLLYIDVSMWPSSKALFFSGHLFSIFNPLESPVLRQASPTVVRSPIDLSDVLEALLELDDASHRSPLGRLRVVLINN